MEVSTHYENIIGKSASDIFKDYSVDEIGKILNNLSEDVVMKRSELKTLVGNKYRELLNVADEIITMNKITKQENEKLMDLAFKKSNYNPKSLDNLIKFNQNVENAKLQKAVTTNRPIILQNVVHDLNYLLMQLKHDIKDELKSSSNANLLSSESNKNDKSIKNFNAEDNNANYQPLSQNLQSNFLIVAKHIHLIDYYFSNDIEQHRKTFSATKYKQLCKEFNHLLDSQLVTLTHEADNEFLTNIFASFLVNQKVSATETVLWILNKRLEYFKFLSDNSAKFEDLLEYIFITLQYIENIKSRSSLVFSRLKNNSDNYNWIKQTTFNEWIKWINQEPFSNSDISLKTDFTFEFSKEDMELSKEKLESIIDNWKSDIALELLSNFDQRFEKSSSNLMDLTVLLNHVLTSFKQFTSLTTLPTDDGFIINYIVDKCDTEYSAQVRNQINQFKNISNIIISTFKNKEEILSTLSNLSNTSSFQYKKFGSRFTIDSFLNTTNSTETTDKVPKLLNGYKSNIKEINNSLELLKSTSYMVKKPVLSVDDYEDDEMWISLSNKLKQIYTGSAESSLKLLNNLITEFLSEVSNILDFQSNVLSNTQIFYILETLNQLAEKIQLNEIYQTLENYLSQSIQGKVNWSESIDPLLGKCFQLILDSKYMETVCSKITNMLEERFNKDDDATETIIWERTLDDKLVATGPSFVYTSLLLTICDDLLYIDDIDYSKLYVTDTFEKTRKDSLEIILNTITSFIKKVENKNVNKTNILLTFSDFLFTMFLLNKEVKDVSEEAKSLFIELDANLSDVEYSVKIMKQIYDNYKTQSLVFFPLTL